MTTTLDKIIYYYNIQRLPDEEFKITQIMILRLYACHIVIFTYLKII